MTTLVDLPPVLSIAHAAVLLDVSPKALQARITRGTYPGRARKFGRSWRLVTADVVAFIEGTHTHHTKEQS